MIRLCWSRPGAEDLITVRGRRLLREADVIIYAGSLVNPGLLKEAGEACRIYNSAVMTLEEVIAVMKQAEAEGLKTVGFTPGILACMARSGSRWTFWIGWEYLMNPVRASVHSARQRLH